MAVDRAAVRDLMQFYKDNKNQAELAVKNIVALFESSDGLKRATHSIRWRVKSLESMERKLVFKAEKAARDGVAFDITPANFFDRVTDCAGFRILHLYTSQFIEIDRSLRTILGQQRYKLHERPFARVWDIEYRGFFEELGLDVQDSASYYTSVHYVVDFNSQSGCKCEIQVRTLAEELWGEVDHALNYPRGVAYVPCQEQIKALARLTSSCTRLVDSIFKSYEYRPRRR